MSTKPKSEVCKAIVPLTNELPAVVRMDVAGEPDLYFVAELPCDVQRARLFEVVGYRRKLAGNPKAVRRYSVMVEEPARGKPAAGVCDCAGGTFHEKAGPCRHLRSLTALWREGKL